MPLNGHPPDWLLLVRRNEALVFKSAMHANNVSTDEAQKNNFCIGSQHFWSHDTMSLMFVVNKVFMFQVLKQNIRISITKHKPDFDETTTTCIVRKLKKV